MIFIRDKINSWYAKQNAPRLVYGMIRIEMVARCFLPFKQLK